MHTRTARRATSLTSINQVLEVTAFSRITRVLSTTVGETFADCLPVADA
jgi:uncharacterized membrane-anchored protein